LKVSGIGENITVKIMDSQCFMNLEEANSLRGRRSGCRRSKGGEPAMIPVIGKIRKVIDRSEWFP
jgi:hypothetical protein